MNLNKISQNFSNLVGELSEDEDDEQGFSASYMNIS